MNFLKKHYEKVILFSLFVIFAILLVHLYFIVQATREVKDEHLEIPTREPDYKVVDVKSDNFNINKLFTANVVLRKSVSRDGNGNKDFSDFIEIFKITRCAKCKYLIPRRVMEESGSCFHCHEKLLPPKKEDVGNKVAARLDSDEDGIPNIVEILFGLNPYDASDALFDLDGDGFVNGYEFAELQNSDEFKRIFSDEYKNISSDEVKNMSLNNPKIHPGLFNGLFVEKIERQKLNANLLGVSVAEGKRKDAWNIQMEITPHPYVRSSKLKRRLQKVGSAYLYIGDKLTLTTGEYLIKDIRKNESGEKKVVKNSANANNLDTSYNVILEDSKKREIIMSVGTDTFDREHKVFCADVWGNKKYSGIVGERIRMGNSNIGVSFYRIKFIDEKKGELILESPVKGGKDIVISKKALIPTEFIPSKEKKEEKKSDSEDQQNRNRH